MSGTVLTNDPVPFHRRSRIVRLLWVLGFAAGVAVGVAAGFGLANA